MPASISPIDLLQGGQRFSQSASTRVLPALCMLALWATPSASFAEGFGPFPVRNFHPLQQLVLNLPGDRAAVLKKGSADVRLELANTASIYSENSPGATATAKFETLRTGLFVRYGATEKLELAMEVPVLYRYRGFMEGAIKAVERATTGLAPARKALSQTGYAYNISRGGQQVVNGTDGALGFGDTTLMTKYQLVSETSSRPTVSLRAAIKLPTGDEAELFGSGSPDFGLGILGPQDFLKGIPLPIIQWRARRPPTRAWSRYPL